MNSVTTYFFLSLCLTFIARLQALGIPDITGWISNVAFSVSESFDATRCMYFECCHKRWSDKDFQELNNRLRNSVYGQNIMIDIIVPALKGHLGGSKAQGGGKALALSFHGRPGIGKNYVSSIIQKVLYHKNSPSQYVHFFTGRIHFPLESETDIYQKNLMHWIKGNVSRCAYSLFVFDEVDKMPARVLDVVKPYLDYHELIDGIDFRKSIFIFLSNTGGDLIAKEYLKHWKSGKKREDLQLRHFEDLIRIGAFNEKGGFYKSEAIESSLIDHYIPFLPLEEQHVRGCVLQEFKRRGIHSPSVKYISEILNDLTFGPEENPIFSNSGCKRISPKVAALVEATKDQQFGRNEL